MPDGRVRLVVMAFGDRPLGDGERAWLEGEVRAACAGFRSVSPDVSIYEEQLDSDIIATLEAKRGPSASSSGWRGFYDLAAVDAEIPAEQALGGAKFLANRSREKVILPLAVQAFGHGIVAGKTAVTGRRSPDLAFWEGEAERYEELASEVRIALQRRWKIPDPRAKSE